MGASEELKEYGHLKGKYRRFRIQGRSRWPGPGGLVPVARSRWPGPGGPVPVPL